MPTKEGKSKMKTRLGRAISKARGDIETDEDIAAAISFGNRAAATLKQFAEEKRCCTICDSKKRCHVCKANTQWACSNCQIDLGATVYVCATTECRNAHERVCSFALRKRLGEEL